MARDAGSRRQPVEPIDRFQIKLHGYGPRIFPAFNIPTSRALAPAASFGGNKADEILWAVTHHSSQRHEQFYQSRG